MENRKLVFFERGFVVKTIRLLKDVTLEGETFKAGTGFKCDDVNAKRLIEEGNAIELVQGATGGNAALALSQTELEKQSSETIQLCVNKALEKYFKDQKEIFEKMIKDDKEKGIDPKGGFKNFGHFCLDVRAAADGRKSEKLLAYEKTIMQEGDDAQGGFLIPTEYRAGILQTALEASIFMPRAQFIPMGSNSVKIPCIYDEDHSGGEFFGGVTIYRVAEGEQKTRSKFKPAQIQLTLNEVAGLVYVSNSLLEDSPVSIEALLNSMFSQAIAFTIDCDCIEGDGAGKPQGFLSSPALVTVTKEAGQAADTIVTENIMKMWSAIHPGSKGRAIWLANHETMKELGTMVVGNAPAWMPANGISGKPYDMFFGRPIYFTEKMKALGDAGDIAVVDPGMYLLGGKAGMNVKTDTSIHLRFDYDETAFRFVIRYDGQGWWKNSLQPKYGAQKLSPFVTLEART